MAIPQGQGAHAVGQPVTLLCNSYRFIPVFSPPVSPPTVDSAFCIDFEIFGFTNNDPRTRIPSYLVNHRYRSVVLLSANAFKRPHESPNDTRDIIASCITLVHCLCLADIRTSKTHSYYREILEKLRYHTELVVVGLRRTFDGQSAVRQVIGRALTATDGYGDMLESHKPPVEEGARQTITLVEMTMIGVYVTCSRAHALMLSTRTA
ncbi:hypothetical protein EDB92DRAFT_1461893 [Lactarius akahatsu]|uniref:Uncharacterized protein n=1 Tax=Lactarius akahatsu TaxID=416441 RepID=A0AAD4LBE9_9AGAM|nr:hypothetical protein EDB92DRAFT_1461893 [Lactarius akahatsu]